MAKLAVIGVCAALLVGCSGRSEVARRPAAMHPFPGFNIDSRTDFDGRLLKLESGAMFGLLGARRSEGPPETMHVELMMLQRMPTPQHSSQTERVAATSQLYEIDCDTGLSRIVGNIGYARSGKVLMALPVTAAPSRWAATVPLFQAICNDDYERLEIRRFRSIAAFLDLFDQVNTSSPPPAPPQVSGEPGK